MPVRIAARLAAAGYLLVAAFQAALALGVPWGEVSWGGRHEGVLPASLRAGSAAAALFLVAAAGVMLLAARPLADQSRQVRLARRVAGALAFLLLLNAFGNLMSESGVEQAVMTPVSVVLGVLTALVAWGPRASRGARAPQTQRGRPKPPSKKRRR
ncbi:MAG: hypothetical protein Q7K37_06405 [Dehalococcoidia bacterium]|nr:hypothetical protein [Dehalococcoidia bacterium]